MKYFLYDFILVDKLFQSYLNIICINLEVITKTNETLIPLLSFRKRRIRALGKQLKHAAAAKAAGIGHSKNN